MKKSICLLALFGLLAGCYSPKQSDSSEFIPSSSENSSEISESSEVSSVQDSSSESLKETREEVLKFNDPSYETRKIESIDDVTSDDLFNLGNRVDVTISISDEELKKLQADYETGYKSEIYRVADSVTIRLTNYGTPYTWEFKNVGIRQKGNTSRENILVNGEINVTNHYKLCFDETFDDPERYSASFIEEMEEKMNGESYEDRTFLDLDGLDFKWNRNSDATHIKEVYASYLYKAGGLIAQRVGLSNLTFIQEDQGNKEYSFGLCTLYEPAKKQLIKKAFQNNENYLNAPSWKEEKKGPYGVSGANYGDLYKCTWGVGEGFSNTGASMSLDSWSSKAFGVGNVSGSYIPAYERKTNTDAEYEDGLIRETIIAFSEPGETNVERYIDSEYLAKICAVNYFIGNPDDFRYNYNNYMLYFRRTDGKMILIPIDNDRVFGITKGMNFENGNTESKPYSKSTFAGEQKNPLLLKTILSSADNQCKKDYTSALKSLVYTPWAKAETFNKYMGIAKATYSDYEFGASNENMSMEKYLNKKIATINSALGTDAPTDNEEESDQTVYDNLYLVGNFNDWGNYPDSDLEKYKFLYCENYTYSITVEIEKSLDDDTLQFKINGGKQDWSVIDWSFNEDLTKLKKEKAGNAILKNVKKGDSVQIRFNTNTLDSEVSVL